MLDSFDWCNDDVKGKFAVIADNADRLHCVISIAPPTTPVLHAPLVRQKLNELFGAQLTVHSFDNLPDSLKKNVIGGGIVITSKNNGEIVVKTEFKSPGIEALVGTGGDTPRNPETAKSILEAVQEWARLIAERSMRKYV